MAWLKAFLHQCIFLRRVRDIKIAPLDCILNLLSHSTLHKVWHQVINHGSQYLTRAFLASHSSWFGLSSIGATFFLVIYPFYLPPTIYISKFWHQTQWLAPSNLVEIVGEAVSWMVTIDDFLLSEIFTYVFVDIMW